MKFIIGKKIEMTQIWQGDKVVAATKVAAGPCVVTQVKSLEKDGYQAIQIGYGQRKPKNINKPQKGHFRDLGNFRSLREFRTQDTPAAVGDRITVGTFEPGDPVDVIGTTKGKGFQGVVRRHGFSGSRKTHGNKDQLRMPGSVGATGPAHVFKGTRMAGRMGGERQTTKNLEIIKIDPEENILYIKGAVPGARNSLVMICGAGELVMEKAMETKAEISKEPEAENKKEQVENVKEGEEANKKELEAVEEKKQQEDKSKK